MKIITDFFPPIQAASKAIPASKKSPGTQSCCSQHCNPSFNATLDVQDSNMKAAPRSYKFTSQGSDKRAQLWDQSDRTCYADTRASDATGTTPVRLLKKQ